MHREMDSTCKCSVSRARWDKVVDRDTLESFIQVVLSVCSENGYSAKTMNRVSSVCIKVSKRKGRPGSLFESAQEDAD